MCFSGSEDIIGVFLTFMECFTICIFSLLQFNEPVVNFNHYELGLITQSVHVLGMMDFGTDNKSRGPARKNTDHPDFHHGWSIGRPRILVFVQHWCIQGYFTGWGVGVVVVVVGGYHIYFHYWCSVYGICKWSDTLWPVGRVRLFADYTISLSSLCRLIWKHWTTKMLVRYMMPSVCLRLRQFSQLSLYSLYGAVCLQLTQLSCDDRENVYFILLSSSNRKYESFTIV